ncbi:MAG TPA: head-tail connector protein, partial [Bacillota bacterium]|nr:head-tail connector protein [Bacillota bacterium]
MAIVTLDEAKEYLRLDAPDEDALVETLIAAAETYLYNATGITYNSA